jgi:hypothetical protein
MIKKEANETIINCINTLIQETQIPFFVLEEIVRPIYDEIRMNAQKEYEQTEQQYEEQLKAYEEANTPAEECPVEPEVIG